MITVVFFDAKSARNRGVCSRTAGKIAMVDSLWKPKHGEATPNINEYWLVRIILETNTGQKAGKLVVQPLKKIEHPTFLVPGMYDVLSNKKGTMILTPSIEGVEWVLPAELKNNIVETHGLTCLVVKIGGSAWRCTRQRKRTRDENRNRNRHGRPR